MRRTFSILCFLAVAWVGSMPMTLPAQAQAEAGLQVLILNSYDTDTAPYFRGRDAFMAELQRHFAEPVAYRQFNLDERGPVRPMSQELQAQLLRIQYADAVPDLVVALGPPAIAFWLEHRDPLFSAVPFAATAAEFAMQQFELRPGDAAVMQRFSFGDLVDNILGVLPETSRVLVVFGSSAHERRLGAMAKTQLEGYAGRVKFEYTNDLALGALKSRVAGLGAGTAVLYGIFDSDVNGVPLGSYSGLAVVREASRAPVFGCFDDQLGRGVVGGRLIELERSGRELALSAREMLRNPALPAPRKTLGLSEPRYDWRELQAWNIAIHRLPPGSVVSFEPPSPWERYSEWIVLTVFVIAAQSLLLLALLLQSRRLRRAEFASASLSSRLITAHEDERRRIARELHDDLSQRLARLSIDAACLASHPGTQAAQEALQSMQPELARIGKDIHDMSYRLHPSLVVDLGIAAALRTECDRLRRRTGVVVVENISDLSGRVPYDTALGLFRIAQEALQNAVKHARADAIEVTLEQDGRMLILAVRDDGVGFDPGSAGAGRGLGLSSMRERARLAKGSLNIRSRPGRGATVIAAVPLEATGA